MNVAHEDRVIFRPELQELVPGATVDVALYWQHWAHEPPSAQRLTAAVKAAAARQLRAPVEQRACPAVPPATARARPRLRRPRKWGAPPVRSRG